MTISPEQKAEGHPASRRRAADVRPVCSASLATLEIYVINLIGSLQTAVFRRHRRPSIGRLRCSARAAGRATRITPSHSGETTSPTITLSLHGRVASAARREGFARRDVTEYF